MISITPNNFSSDVTLYVTRHGKTMFNTVERVQGWADTPLTPQGVEVVEQLGRGLKDTDFVAVYSSDLGRARETARIVLREKESTLPLIEMLEFREICFGSFEGDFDANMWGAVSRKLGYNNKSELLKAFNDEKLAVEEMVDALKSFDQSGMAEDYAMLKNRTFAGLQEVAKKTQEKGGGNVLIVTHGMVLLMIMNELLGKPLGEELVNASVTKIRYTQDGQFIIESTNDTSYIEKGK